MPNRIIRESILTSDRMASLSWPAEVFYRRLLSVIDDYGRFDGRPDILRARLYPLQLDKVASPDVSSWIATCEKAGLISLYTVEKKPYIEVFNFNQQIRSASKYPPPPGVCAASDSSCAQLRTLSVSESVSVSPLTPQGGKRLRKRNREAEAAAAAESQFGLEKTRKLLDSLKGNGR